MFRSELNSMENFDEFEANNFLHDLNSAVYFEDTKISPDILSLMDTNMLDTDDSLVNINKDPATDPLFISDFEENDVDTSLMNSKSSVEKSVCTEQISGGNDSLKKQISSGNDPLKKQKQLNTKEKHLLKELENIQNCEKLPLTCVKVN